MIASLDYDRKNVIIFSLMFLAVSIALIMGAMKMSDAYKGLDDLRVNPFVTPKQELKARAQFKCPMCGETIEMIFSKEDLKKLMKGIDVARA